MKRNDNEFKKVLKLITGISVISIRTHLICLCFFCIESINCRDVCFYQLVLALLERGVAFRRLGDQKELDTGCLFSHPWHNCQQTGAMRRRTGVYDKIVALAPRIGYLFS